MQQDLTTLIIMGHGTKDSDGIRQFENLVDIIIKLAPNKIIKKAYLEFQSPTLKETVLESLENGIKNIIVQPALLINAMHSKIDIPKEIIALRQIHPQANIVYGKAVGIHYVILKLCRQILIEAMARSKYEIKPSQTCLVLVGRGTTDPDSNSEIYKLSRLLEEGMHFQSSVICYSGTAKPSVAEGLKRAIKLNNKSIIVFPFMLFDGVLVKRIYDACDVAIKSNTDMHLIKADYLNASIELASVILERANEAINGEAFMNCSLCKYNVPLIGFENQSNYKQDESRLNKDSQNDIEPYVMNDIERKSFEIINASFDWSKINKENLPVVQRLVHTSGDFSNVHDLFISDGAIEIGFRNLMRCKQIVTDVSMVQSGIKRDLLAKLKINVWCGVHDEETYIMAKAFNITRSAAGMRRAYDLFGNNVILAIGDAPTALFECLRLIKNNNWRPQLIIGLPVGFVGTVESKNELINCLQIPRITNSGNKGGSPWAASVINALLIECINYAWQNKISSAKGAK